MCVVNLDGSIENVLHQCAFKNSYNYNYNYNYSYSYSYSNNHNYNYSYSYNYNYNYNYNYSYSYMSARNRSVLEIHSNDNIIRTLERARASP